MWSRSHAAVASAQSISAWTLCCGNGGGSGGWLTAIKSRGRGDRHLLAASAVAKAKDEVILPSDGLWHPTINQGPENCGSNDSDRQFDRVILGSLAAVGNRAPCVVRVAHDRERRLAVFRIPPEGSAERKPVPHFTA